MRARLIITLAICLSTLFGRARADQAGDFRQAPEAPGLSGGADTPPPDYPALDERAGTAGAARAPAPSRQHFVHPSLGGLVGGVHVIDARSASPGTFRIALQTSFFGHDGFVTVKDQHRFASTALNINVTPIEHLELAGQFATYSTENRRLDTQVVQVIGDVHLYAKGYAHILPWLTAGGDLELALLNGLGTIGVAGGATSVALRGNTSFDFRALTAKLPLLARANLRYLFDNSGRLIRDVERARYGSLSNATNARDEHRHLVSAAERYALRVNRVDRLSLGFGAELPFTPHPLVHVNPLVEWSVAVPVNRQDYDCVVTQVADDRDGCLRREGFAARPSALSLGVRVQPYVRGLGVLLAVDLATSGSRTFVRELAPESRYLLQLAVSYAYDPRPAPQTRVRIERVEIPAGGPRGHVLGEVVESQTGKPIASAIVHFEGTSLSDLVTDAEGTFRSAELPPGPQGMRIRAEGYREALCVAVVPTSGTDVAARCELTPGAHYGGLRGRISTAAGEPIAGAQVNLSGPAELALVTAGDGTFASDKLIEGRYRVELKADGFFARQTSVTVERERESSLALVLHARPAQPLVRLLGKRFLLRRPVLFEPETAVLKDESHGLLAELADQLQKHPEITRLEVQAHVDDSGDPGAAQALSELRARAVRDWLVAAGISEERLELKAYGASKPLVPNITLQNRARNRRIEFVVK